MCHIVAFSYVCFIPCILDVGPACEQSMACSNPGLSGSAKELPIEQLVGEALKSFPSVEEKCATVCTQTNSRWGMHSIGIQCTIDQQQQTTQSQPARDHQHRQAEMSKDIPQQGLREEESDGESCHLGRRMKGMQVVKMLTTPLMVRFFTATFHLCIYNTHFFFPFF